jgi:hypothetical protein
MLYFFENLSVTKTIADEAKTALPARSLYLVTDGKSTLKVVN